MSWRLGGLVVLLVAFASPARAQFGHCAGLADPATRLECYDRSQAPAAQRGAPPPPAARAAPEGNCTRAAPCTGPRGGRYYYTPSGAKRYVRR